MVTIDIVFLTSIIDTKKEQVTMVIVILRIYLLISITDEVLIILEEILV